MLKLRVFSSKLNKTILTVITAVLLLLNTTAVIAQSYQLSDPDDLFYVTNPAPNAVVKNNVTTKWRAYDDGQSNIAYELTLRDRATCSNLVGTISAGNKASSTNINSLTWSSDGPLQDVSKVSDGTYCIQLCVSLEVNGTPYTACSGREITIRNHNSAPVITSRPPADRRIYPNHTWNYNVNATDRDGDKLTYRFESAPRFLSINRNSGWMYTNSRAKAVGTYNIRVAVVDGFGGKDTQSFRLIVEKRPTTTTTNPDTTATPEPDTGVVIPPTEPESEEAPFIQILKPIGSTEYSGKDNLISWRASDPDGIKEFKLYYYKLGTEEERTEIATLSAEETTFNWDVNDFEDGSYVVELEMYDNVNDQISITSEAFTINNSAEVTNPPVTTKPLIINVSPEDLAEIEERRPLVTGEFSKPIDREIDISTFQFVVDGEAHEEWCTVLTERGFQCTPDRDLDPGDHKIQISVKDSEGELAQREVTFKILGAEEIAAKDNGLLQNLSSSTFVILCLVCAVAFILIFVPWWLYVMWSRRGEDYVEAEEYTETEYDYGTPSTYTDYSDYSYTNDNYSAPASIAPAPVEETTYTETRTVDNSEIVDPTQYETYEDYVAAVGSTDQNTNQTTVAETTTTENQTDPNYIGTTDYSDLYTSEDEDEQTSETTEVREEDSNDNTPDWLRSPS